MATEQKSARISSFEVGRLANVSRSTVSRALADDPAIPAATKERVLQAAQLLGYRPNRLARSLTKQRSSIVGLVFSDLNNPFYAAVLDAVTGRLEQEGFASLLFVSRDVARIDDVVSQLLAYQVDGVIVAAATLSAKLTDQCRARGKPVVLINRYVQSAEISFVSGENSHGGRLVAEHLISIGAKRFAFLAGIENTSSNRDRREGFAAALRAHGIADYAYDVGNYRYEDARLAARRLLSAQPRPDAIFCANDVMASAVIDVARNEFGLDVPRELAVAGYDDTTVASWPMLNLTSVDQRIGDMTEQTVSLLLKQIRDPAAAPEQHFIAPELIVRGSSRREP